MSARVLLAAIGLVGLAAGQAEASVISFRPGAALSSVPLTITFGTGASYSFIAAATGSGPGAAVQGIGSNKVASFGGVADFEFGSTIDQVGELYSFSTFNPAKLIPNSLADDFIGLDFTLADGIHYGYAEVNGASLVSYGYNTTPNASILTGAVPEPASLALLLLGAGGIIATRFRRKP